MLLLRCRHSANVRPRDPRPLLFQHPPTQRPATRHQSSRHPSTRSPAPVACMHQGSGSTEPGQQQRIVIAGGGIIGACTAYYLAERGVAERVTVVEREGIACAASGKAGGFLAQDWNDGSPTQDLARLSFKLHAELADRFGAASIGYRTVHTLQVSAMQGPAPNQQRRPAGNATAPPWVDAHVVSARQLGTPSTTAQVHPRLLTQALMDSAVARGASLVTGTAHGITRTAGGGLQGLLVDGRTLDADVVVLAMGPWTSLASAWLPATTTLAISGLKYHSCVLKPQQPISNHCLEVHVLGPGGRQMESEIYPRPDGTVYVCGQPQHLAVPPSASQVAVDPQQLEQVWQAAAAVSTSLGKGQASLEAQQACFLPISADGQPLIGQVPELPGVYVAAGHSCWGILNGPATGKCLAELILDGKVSCLAGGLGAALGLEPSRAG